MPRGLLLSGVLLAALSWVTPSPAQWKKLLEQAVGGDSAADAARAGLSHEDVVAGLKEALARGAETAVATLGRSDGFLGNAAVRIPLPAPLQPVERVLQAVGQQRYSDEFVATMNRAAERAVPEAGAILGDAIREMSVADARRILNGPDDAATQYFREVGSPRLTARLRPIVSKATARAGVTQSYKALVDGAGGAARLVSADAIDLDGYVTARTLDGLFLVIAAQEKRIRQDPAARTSELLAKVFGK